MKFEERMGDLDRCRSILERYIDVNPVAGNYIKAAKFEERHRNRENARMIYTKALAELGKLAYEESFFIQFTNLEVQDKEFERAKTLFKFGLENIPNCKKL